MSWGMSIEDMLHYGALFDFYGSLLTDAQHDIVYEYITLNETLSEIAENKHITKQAVSDALGKALKKLDFYEDTLHLVAKFQNILAQVDKVALDLLDDEDLARRIGAKYKDLIKSLED